MNKHETIKGPSCLTNAEDDEPLFVLRANDELAPEIVLQWAINYAQSKRAIGQYTEARQKKFDDAVRLSVEMRKWKQLREAQP